MFVHIQHAIQFPVNALLPFYDKRFGVYYSFVVNVWRHHADKTNYTANTFSFLFVRRQDDFFNFYFKNKDDVWENINICRWPEFSRFFRSEIDELRKKIVGKTDYNLDILAGPVLTDIEVNAKDEVEIIKYNHFEFYE